MNTEKPTIILSDDEPSDSQQHDLTTPTRPQHQPDRTVVVLLDDPTPQKPTPSFVPETPFYDLPNIPNKFAGITGVICLESDNESENGSGREKWEGNESRDAVVDTTKNMELASSSRIIDCTRSSGNFDLGQTNRDFLYPTSSFQLGMAQQDDNFCNSFHESEWEHDCQDKENYSVEQIGNSQEQKRRKACGKENSSLDEAMKKKLEKEKRARLMDEKKQKKEEEKLQKAALKAQTAEMKKLEKEKQKWEKGKFALKSIVAEIDNKIVELGSVGGQLLTRFAEKGLAYRIKRNPIEGSILWTMTVPEHISQLSPSGSVVPYVLFIYDAGEFCNLVSDESLLAHAYGVRSQYPSYTLCYLTNRLHAYVNKREKEHYKNPATCDWRCPPVEEALAKLSTNFSRVHSRQCIDEAEIAEHIVGLTCSLASCQFRKKLTRLSVNANGALISKDCIERNLIKKNLWSVMFS